MHIEHAALRNRELGKRARQRIRCLHPILASTAASKKRSLHGPYQPTQVVAAFSAYGIAHLQKSRLVERREPVLARDEPSYIPPPAEKTEQRIKRPRCAAIVGMRTPLTKYHYPAFSQHRPQVTQSQRLVLGAMQSIDGKNGVELLPPAFLVEIVTVDRP